MVLGTNVEFFYATDVGGLVVDGYLGSSTLKVAIFLDETNG